MEHVIYVASIDDEGFRIEPLEPEPVKRPSWKPGDAVLLAHVGRERSWCLATVVKRVRWHGWRCLRVDVCGVSVRVKAEPGVGFEGERWRLASDEERAAWERGDGWRGAAGK